MRIYNLFLSLLIPISFIGEVSSESYEKNSLIKDISISQKNNTNPKPKHIYSDKEPTQDELAVILDRAKAVGAVAGINCGARKNNDQRDLNDIYLKVFNELEINYLYEWIERPFALEAIRIMSEYFDAECKISNQNQKEIEARVYPYLFDLSNSYLNSIQSVYKLREDAEIAFNNKNFLLAENKQLEALDISRKNNLSKDLLVRIYISLSRIYKEKKEQLKALDFLNNAEKAFDKKIDFVSPLNLYVLIFKTDTLIELERYENGLKNAEISIKLSNNMVDRFPENKEFQDVFIYALLNTTYHFMKVGNTKKTDKYANLGIEAISKYKSPLDLQIADLIGNQMLVRQKDFTLIKPEQINEYIELSKRNYFLRRKVQGEYHLDTISARRSLADIFLRSGKVEKGLDLLEENVEISNKKFGLNSEVTIREKSRLASEYFSQNNYRNALPLLLENHRIIKKVFGKNSKEFVDSGLTLASIYERLNQFQKAKLFGEESYEIAKNIMNIEDATQRVYWTLFTIYTGLNDEKSLAKIDLKLPETEIKFNPSTITAFEAFNISRHIFKLPLDERISLLENLLIAKKRIFGVNSIEVANETDFLGSQYFINNDLENSSKYYEECLIILKSIYPDENNIKFLKPYLALVQINVLKGDIKKAKNFLIKSDSIERNYINYIAQNLDSEARISLLDSFWLNKELLYNYGISYKDGKKLILLNLLNTKGILADLEHKQGLLMNGSEAIKKKHSRLLELIKITSNLKSSNLNRKKLIEEKQNLEVSLYSELPLLKTSEVQINEVSSQLNEDSVLIEFVKLFKRDLNTHVSNESHDKGYEYYAVILYPDSNIDILNIGKAEVIENLINKVLISSENENPQAFKLYKQLSNLIIDPIINKTKGYKNWFLSPDGELNRVPFFGLFHNKSNKYLSEIINIRLLTSGRELLKLQPTNSIIKNKALVVANPSFNKKSKNSKTNIFQFDKKGGLSKQRSADLNFFDWSDLPGTAKEGEVISKIINAKFLTGNEASVSEIEKQSAPLITHIASHSYYLPNKQKIKSDDDLKNKFNIPENPLLRSGIVLAGANNQEVDKLDDGFLTALEVTKLNWEGTEMVVISGCESGMGDIQSGEGVYGLKRAIAVSGAKSSLLSLWKVDDSATAAFMKSFYLKLLDDKGKAESLSLTQKEFRNHPIPGFRHPYVWAAFQLSGDWRSINW